MAEKPDSDDDARLAMTLKQKRRYSIGGMAGSYVPRGVRDILNRSREQRRQAWRDADQMSTGAFVSLCIGIIEMLACIGVAAWGFLTGRSALVGVALLALFGLWLCTPWPPVSWWSPGGDANASRTDLDGPQRDVWCG